MAHGSRSRGDRADKPRSHFFGDHSVRMWTVFGGIAAVLSVPTAVLIAYWTSNAQNATPVSPSLHPTLVPSTAGASPGSLNSPRSNRIGAYSLVLSSNEYSPLRADRPTFLEIQKDTLKGDGDIQWRSVDAYDQFNSGTQEYMAQLPYGTTTPTFEACIAQTTQAPSVHARPGSAFCMSEPGNIIVGVSVKSIDQITGKAYLQITIWKYSS
jgi:hypothetical protein